MSGARFLCEIQPLRMKMLSETQLVFDRMTDEASMRMSSRMSLGMYYDAMNAT